MEQSNQTFVCDAFRWLYQFSLCKGWVILLLSPMPLGASSTYREKTTTRRKNLAFIAIARFFLLQKDCHRRNDERDRPRRCVTNLKTEFFCCRSFENFLRCIRWQRNVYSLANKLIPDADVNRLFISTSFFFCPILNYSSKEKKIFSPLKRFWDSDDLLDELSKASLIST